MANNFTYDGAGLALTERFEGLRLVAYKDIVGYWTIGYGHKGPGVVQGMTINQAQAETLLQADVLAASHVVNRVVTYPLTQVEFDALVDLAFNIGIGAFASSQLVRLLNSGNVSGAADQFKLWDHAGGKAIQALLNRRLAEAALFQTNVAV